MPSLPILLTLFPLRSPRPRLVPMAVKRRDILVPPHRREIELVHIVKRYRAHGAALRRPADAVAFHSFFLLTISTNSSCHFMNNTHMYGLQ